MGHILVTTPAAPAAAVQRRAAGNKHDVVPVRAGRHGTAWHEEKHREVEDEKESVSCAMEE